LPTSTRPRPTVGLLLDALYNEYASMVVGAFDAECTRRDLDLMCFAGGSLESPAGYERKKKQRKIILAEFQEGYRSQSCFFYNELKAHAMGLDNLEA
jgi:hypothetical protein